MEGCEYLSLSNSICSGLRVLLKNSFLHAVVEFPEELDAKGSCLRSRSSPARLANYEKPPPGESTLMIRNIPTKFTQASLLSEFHKDFDTSCIDFFYLPIDFKSEKNLGYAFVNFVSNTALNCFLSVFQRARLSANSSKVLALSLAKVQGLERNYNLFKTSSVMTHAPAHFRPMMKCESCGELMPMSSTGVSTCEKC